MATHGQRCTTLVLSKCVVAVKIMIELYLLTLTPCITLCTPRYGPVEMPTGNGISFQPIMARYIRHYRGRVDLGPWGPTFVELEAYGPPEIEASPDICDITVDICEKFDTSAIEAVARSMASALNPILSTITSTANGRRLLAAANGKNNFLPIIGLTIGVSVGRCGSRCRASGASCTAPGGLTFVSLLLRVEWLETKHIRTGSAR